ncbi:hypothetical protein Lfu02_74030 [Longispora fulva]|uniref:Uncharacterized protein n=1 Tax=Longispora fulva TaxID=619741 RepID=A0A8J7G9S4_9ACTN|nr:hypothetical protein [Longispora fulva]GIG63031.1 hypothetical protein Lfu02_74030 [Longispora fulva]
MTEVSPGSTRAVGPGLAEVRFVLAGPVGDSRRYRVGEACLSRFATAADIVMGKPAPDPGGRCS